MHLTKFAWHIAAAAALAVAFTAPAARSQTCAGDCSGTRAVSVADLVTAVQIALDGGDADACSLDLDGDGVVRIHELLAAVRNALEGCPPLAYPLDDELRLNQIQALGSHNSFHIRPDPPILEQIGAGLATLWGYDHIPLMQQFDTQGVRQIELDVYYDPLGGLYASPYALRFVTNDPNARLPEREAPGFKVMHVQDLDYKSVCPTFVACLEEVKAWSDAHPLHLPIMILVEAKEDILPDLGLGFVVPLPINGPELDALDVEIRSVFPPEQMITPDDVRGTHATLREAVQTDGWPTLRESRGKVLFCLDNEGKRDVYIQGHPSLQGRVLFTSSPPNAPEAAFRKLNSSVGDFEEIQEAVRGGLIVRTRADADTLDARANDTTSREAAINSGAQWVSTDYPVPDPAIGTGYMVQIPGGTPARCNPLIAPEHCTSLDIENPAHLVE